MCKWETDRPSLKGMFKNVQVYWWQILTDSTYQLPLFSCAYWLELNTNITPLHAWISFIENIHTYICSSRNPSVANQMLDMRWTCLLSTPDLPGIQKWSIKKVKGMPRYTHISAMWAFMKIPFWTVDAWQAWFLSGVVFVVSSAAVIFAVHCTNVLKSKKNHCFSSFLEDRTGNDRCVSQVF